MESRWVVETLGEVAEFFGVELVTVREWRTGPTPMPGEPGAYDIKAATRWRCEKLKGNINQKSKEMVELEIREKQADVQKKELNVRKQRGDLVSRTAIKAAVSGLLNDARLQLEAIPGVVAAHVPPDMRNLIRQEWEQQISLILRGFAGKAGDIVDNNKP